MQLRERLGYGPQQRQLFVAQINRLAVVVRLGFEPELQEIGQSKFESYMPL